MSKLILSMYPTEEQATLLESYAVACHHLTNIYIDHVKRNNLSSPQIKTALRTVHTTIRDTYSDSSWWTELPYILTESCRQRVYSLVVAYEKYKRSEITGVACPKAYPLMPLLPFTESVTKLVFSPRSDLRHAYFGLSRNLVSAEEAYFMRIPETRNGSEVGWISVDGKGFNCITPTTFAIVVNPGTRMEVELTSTNTTLPMLRDCCLIHLWS